MRGKHTDCYGELAISRITPAGAGKTIFVSRDIDESWDHPRRCGENIHIFHRVASDLGSPPQVRGKRNGGLIMRILNRITPAGAGKTSFIRLLISVARDHPRRCGENFLSSFTSVLCSGSPPQVRGKQSSIFMD